MLIRRSSRRSSSSSSSAKYANNAYPNPGWKLYIFAIEVGAKGFILKKYFNACIKQMNIPKTVYHYISVLTNGTSV